MSHGYQAIQWTPYKRRYDVVMVGLVLAYLALFFIAGKLVWRGTHGLSDEILLIRATATCAFAMLNVILCIGPLARLDHRFLPLLYNRRHLGVLTFLVSLVHAAVVLGFYHGFGIVSPVNSLLTSNVQYRSVSGFPFEILGLIALAIMFLMAATSHDFWLKNLSPRVWKSLHMLVYVAWGLLVLHIALGALQSEKNPIYVALPAFSVITVVSLHLIAGWREVRRDINGSGGDLVDVGSPGEFIEQCGKVIALKQGERVAIFRNNGKLSAVSNVCAHQGGPLGEGRIIDGCITCPWHGFTYQPHNGCAPEPFTEKLPTFRLRLKDGRVYLDATALEPGTAVEPLEIAEASHV